MVFSVEIIVVSVAVITGLTVVILGEGGTPAILISPGIRIAASLLGTSVSTQRSKWI